MTEYKNKLDLLHHPFFILKASPLCTKKQLNKLVAKYKKVNSESFPNETDDVLNFALRLDQELRWIYNTSCSSQADKASGRPYLSTSAYVFLDSFVHDEDYYQYCLNELKSLKVQCLDSDLQAQQPLNILTFINLGAFLCLQFKERVAYDLLQTECIDHSLPRCFIYDCFELYAHLDIDSLLEQLNELRKLSKFPSIKLSDLEHEMIAHHADLVNAFAGIMSCLPSMQMSKILLSLIELCEKGGESDEVAEKFFTQGFQCTDENGQHRPYSFQLTLSLCEVGRKDINHFLIEQRKGLKYTFKQILVHTLKDQPKNAGAYLVLALTLTQSCLEIVSPYMQLNIAKFMQTQGNVDKLYRLWTNFMSDTQCLLNSQTRLALWLQISKVFAVVQAPKIHDEIQDNICKLQSFDDVCSRFTRTVYSFEGGVEGEGKQTAVLRYSPAYLIKPEGNVYFCDIRALSLEFSRPEIYDLELRRRIILSLFYRWQSCLENNVPIEIGPVQITDQYLKLSASKQEYAWHRLQVKAPSWFKVETALNELKEAMVLGKLKGLDLSNDEQISNLIDDLPQCSILKKDIEIWDLTTGNKLAVFNCCQENAVFFMCLADIMLTSVTKLSVLWPLFTIDKYRTTIS